MRTVRMTKERETRMMKEGMAEKHVEGNGWWQGQVWSERREQWVKVHVWEKN